MIAILTWIKTYKWFAAAALTLALLVGYRVWLAVHDHRITAKEETTCQVVNDTATIQSLTDQLTAEKAANEKYRDELETLANGGAGSPAPVVRLCPSPARPRVPAAGQVEAPPTGVLPPLRVGRDIGPQLFGLADEADQIVAECRRATRSE